MVSSGIRIKYRKPPVVEVVLEFQFQPSPSPWDSVYFGKIHDRLLRIANLPKVQSAPPVLAFGHHGLRLASARRSETKRFVSPEGGIVVTVGPNLLGVSVLPQKHPGGHPGWDYLRDLAFGLLPSYEEVVKPHGVRRIGLRYINRINVKPGEFLLGDYINADAGVVPPVLLSERNPFSLRFEHGLNTVQEGRFREAVQLVARPSAAGGGELVLNIDEVITSSSAVPRERLGEFCERAHEAAWSLFDKVFTETLRARFDPQSATSGVAP